MHIIEILKVIIIGIVEGITEWLPISSTGHMILLDEFIKLNITSEFKEIFLVFIQLGAILAVLFVFFNKINPLNKKQEELKDTLKLWLMIIISCLPAAVIGLLFDDWVYDHFYNSFTVALALIIYGIIFILVEHKQKKVKINSLKTITEKTALLIGMFQLLAIIPGTSRSGATIIGGLLLGMNRSVITEYTFILALPVMIGASLLKIIKFGFVFTNTEILILIIGMLTAFIVSFLTVKYLLKYVKKHDFKIFGWYRIILGIVIIIYFIIK
ncbi:MAG TPA: undecaprenyl-diphosphate phosphatase [Bacilli bacterium]|nr:undecaprenyl-diphosphate phosphatase [Bacilli bacterium]